MDFTKKRLPFRTRLVAVLCAVAVSLTLAGCAQSSSQNASSAVSSTSSGPRTITDMLGNKVKIPEKVNSVYCTSPIGTYIMYTLAPDKLLGWNAALDDAAKPYIEEKYQSLPVLGGTQGGKSSFNTEQIIKLKPDIIIDVAHKGEIPDNVKQLATQTGIPVVELDDAIASTEKAYRFLGDVLGEQTRAKILADYVKKSLADTKSMLAKVPEDKKLKVYYAEADTGLKTDGSDSMHTDVLNFVGAENVATVESAQVGTGVSVSMEQVLSWNPDVILASSQMGGTTFLKNVYQNAEWSSISAVKNKRVYLIPTLPFNWFDRPPSIARVLGVEWLGNLLYPDYVKVDMKAEVKKFYSTFYRVKVTDEQAATLLNTTEG